MSTILPNVESFRSLFLPAILAELDEKYRVAKRDLKGFHAAWLNASGDCTVHVAGRALTTRDIIAGKNGYASARDIDWRATSVPGVAQDTLAYICDMVEAERPEWFVKTSKVYAKSAPSVDMLAELGL